MNPKYERQLKKGAFELMVLSLLAEEKKYGYQLISELKERSHDTFSLKEGTLYPILYRLEDDGLVSSEWSVPTGREVSRKYYTITAEGTATLKELLATWHIFEDAVNQVLTTEL